MMKTVVLEFVVPRDARAVTTSAEVMWKDRRGRFGAQFLGMEADTRKLLSQWLITEHRANEPVTSVRRCTKRRVELRSAACALPRKSKHAPHSIMSEHCQGIALRKVRKWLDRFGVWLPEFSKVTACPHEHQPNGSCCSPALLRLLGGPHVGA